jgi:hypothetical protein
MRPATCVDGGAGIGDGGAGVGACALAALVKATKTKRAISASDATTRGLDIGTKEYHAVL